MDLHVSYYDVVMNDIYTKRYENQHEHQHRDNMNRVHPGTKTQWSENRASPNPAF